MYMQVDDVVLCDLHIHRHRALSTRLRRRIAHVRQHRRCSVLRIPLLPSPSRTPRLPMRDPAAPAQQAPHPPQRTSRLFTLALNQALIRLASPPSNSNYLSGRFSSSVARASVMLYYAPPKSIWHRCQEETYRET
ncbi:hypothetical protein HGRIS_001046 [Hohenbuehelia grisea]|uniref:Uncharacterized protein n=1 Tax=Hohenbuehelia grisea TaxID=104357 RepID=A0ABR3JP00_9AGAR